MTKPEHNRALRELLKVLRDENTSLEHQVRAAESFGGRASVRADASEMALTYAMLAVRILAKAVSSTTVEGRKARAAAREVLEQRGIRPPGTLGSSRTKKRRRRQRLDDPSSP